MWKYDATAIILVFNSSARVRVHQLRDGYKQYVRGRVLKVE